MKLLDQFVAGQRPDAKSIPDLPYLRDLPSQQMTLERGQGAAERGGYPPATSSGPAKQLSQREAKRHLRAYGGSDAIDWVMDCVSLLAETAANATYHWEKEGKAYVAAPDPGNPNADPAAPPLLAKLFERPNPYQDYVEFMELLVIDLLLVGNAYWLKYKTNASGQPLSLYRLAPPYITVVPGAFGIEKYIYKVSGQQQPLEIDPADVVHFRRPNPHDPYLGLGVVQGGARAMDLELALTNTQASYFENHARPSGVVQSERAVAKSTMDKLKLQLRGLHSGPSKAGELMVLEAGLKYQSISPSATDAAFEVLASASRDRICAMFRTPLALLGIITQSNLKIPDAQRVYDTKTVRPLLNRLQKCISYGLTQAWGFDFVIEYQYIMPPEEKLRLTGQFSTIPGVMVDEVRKYADLPPHPDTTIGELTLNLPGENGNAGNTRNGFPDRNVVGAGEAGRPPKPENTKPFPAGGAPLPAGAAARRPSEKAMSPDEAAARLDAILTRGDVVDSTAEEIEPDVKALTRKVGHPGDPIGARRDGQVDAVANAIDAELVDPLHYLERGLLDALEGKAGGARTRIMASGAWQTFSKRLSSILEKGAERAIGAAAVHQGAARGEPVELDTQRLAREVVYRPEGVRAIFANMRRAVSARVQKAEEAGSSPAELEAAVRAGMDAWRHGHAETIGLTEAVEAYNEGTLSALETAGDEETFVDDGHDYDAACADANGQVWSISYARAHRTEHPRCRRFFLAAPSPASV